ncbi:hypothetical protein DAEQUDRAFT_809411 [Daedalea quercina L-15889]|uniref:Glycosyltransferase 61 catalytic domain-containing protein n=1 Tax=Daedalea quercina L-15889 TaxID=1314783 RepID=A0A165SL11_9APHY|nr:hypothetical protein DAEQUDRAFT_809411 [Daedalea quercina L-15889]
MAMGGLPRTRSLRDVVLILLGATTMHLASVFMGFHEHSGSIIVKTEVSSHFLEDYNNTLAAPAADDDREKSRQHDTQKILDSGKSGIDVAYELPETTVLSHAPGWTVFQNLYMSNGTLYIVTSEPASFPHIRMVTSTGLAAENTPENIAAREPTERDMDVISPAEARRRWGSNPDRGERNRVWSVGGNTVLVNEPSQFLDHYYHFCAELVMGVWPFWLGTFNVHVDPSSPRVSAAPHIDRMIFAHAEATGWRDGPGFNSYFLRAGFPSMTVEVETDWRDRIAATATRDVPERAWHFDTLMLTDRSAAFRGESCGSRNQRIASESIEHMEKMGTLSKWWWEPLRQEVLRFAGVDQETLEIGTKADAVAARKNGAEVDWAGSTSLSKPQSIVITYISRQGARRHLIDEDHQALVHALTAMCTAHHWELNIVQAENLTHDEQLKLVARTTVLLGVHGNGLTHLIMMPVTPISTVIEIFYPTGYANDYKWTAHALGMKHFAVWNDTYHTYPEQLLPSYPEGFQGTQIPVYAPVVTQIIQDRIAGRLP